MWRVVDVRSLSSKQGINKTKTKHRPVTLSAVKHSLHQRWQPGLVYRAMRVYYSSSPSLVIRSTCPSSSSPNRTIYGNYFGYAHSLGDEQMSASYFWLQPHTSRSVTDNFTPLVKCADLLKSALNSKSFAKQMHILSIQRYSKTVFFFVHRMVSSNWIAALKISMNWPQALH